MGVICVSEATSNIREDVKIPTYKPHTNHKRSSVRSHTLAPTSICDLSHSLCWRPPTDLGHISSVTYVCHPLWFVCGHRKGILTSPLRNYVIFYVHILGLHKRENTPYFSQFLLCDDSILSSFEFPSTTKTTIPSSVKPLNNLSRLWMAT